GAHSYYKWLTSAGVCKSIDQLDVFGVSVTLSTAAGVGGDWIVRGYANWTSLFGTGFEDINGKRYEAIYGLVGAAGPDQAAGVVDNTDHPHDTVPIAVVVQGYETIGDATGIVITSPVRQAEHFVTNFLAVDVPDYGRSEWLTVSPTFSAFPTLTLVDHDSATAVDALLQARIPGGYETAGVIGANGEDVAAEDAIARICVSGD